MIDILSDQVSKNVVKNSLDKIIKKGKAATTIQKRMRGIITRNKLPEIMEEADRQAIMNRINQVEQRANTFNKAAETIQGAIRNRTAKREMMKQRQAADEIKLREMEAIKDKSIKDDAGKQLQAKIKRIRPRKDLLNVYKAKEKIGANVKTLLTEQADSQYFPNTKRTMIWNNKTVGQPLVVSKKLKLVSKKKHDAAVEGYQNRQVFLELADKYKDVMTKGKK